MDYLWTPWRYAYITTAAKSTPSDRCIFCELPKLPDEKALIVHRAEHCFIILNSFPYTSGHVMVVPFAHLDQLQKLPRPAAAEMMLLSQKMEGILRQVYYPDGINIGMNIRIMPVTGIPLPLLSYGGSSVVCSLIAIGMLQNVYIYRKGY